VSEREIFLHDIPLEDARARFFAALESAGVRIDDVERVTLDDALDRVTAAPVFARLSSPHYHACAMDGIAVAAARTAGARETAPLELELGREAFIVDTGDPLPPGTDAVVMIEQVEARANGRVAIRAAVAPFDHVRPIGEDVVATEAVVARRRTLEPADLAAIASAGITSVEVVRRPRIAIITTGDELVDPDVVRPERGAILDSNGVLLAASVRRYGGTAVRYPRVRDDRGELRAAIERALRECDVVVVNAGSSAGREDFTARVFGELGTVLVHGVAIRPGHPLVLALAHEGTPLLGIPGYPVSAAICADLFLRPLIERLAQREAPDDSIVEVELTRKLFSPLGEDEFVRAVAARVGPRLVATPLRRGAGVITSLSRANCLITIPRFSEGAPAGTKLPARALRPRATIERTLLAVGSHDVALDLLAGAIAGDGVPLVSANVGSIAGLVALRDGATHLAGTHVLDRASGTYNDAAVRRYGPAERVALVHFAQREQGLIVAPGNPLGLRSLADVAACGARYVNRQKDAGTRMLLDALLEREGLEQTQIAGYDRIEFTHLAVAALVADGSADCGIGIRAAARALACDFVPLAFEPYELALLARDLDDPRIARVLAALASPALRAQIEALGGYDASAAGTVRFVETVTADAR
jgi:putative molybdopterin biosynthesis protein